MENPSFENDAVLLEIREGTLYAQYKVAEIDLATAEESTRIRQSVVGNRTLPSIVDISLVKRVPKETRIFFSSAQAGEGLSAIAVVISNPVTRTIGNFFLKFHQPNYPCKMFTSLDEASVWVHQFVQNQELCS